MGPSPPPAGEFKNPLASETLGSSRLWSRPASGLGEAGSVYTCHEGGGGRKREPQQSPKLLRSSREGAAGAELWAGGSGGTGRAGGGRGGDDDSHFPGRCLGWQRRKLYASGAAAGFPAPAAEEGRAQARSPQARRASTSPQRPAPRQTGAPCPGEGLAGGLGPLTLFPPSVAGGRGAVALTWLVRGGRDGHGSGGRGGTGSPGKDWLFRRGAGESGRQSTHSPVSEAAPWTPTRSFSAAAEPPSHYPPPSSAAAAAACTSSSAETPRPLHTLSHHAAREPLLPNVTSGRRWLGRGRTLVGAGEARGRETPWELVSQNAAPRRRRAQSAGRHFG